MSSLTKTPRNPDQPFRILAIDDDPSSTQLTKLALEESGAYTVCEMNDPRRAVAAADEFQPDLIIMDVDMPRLDGRTAAALIQAKDGLENVPILFLTSMIPESAGTNAFGWFGPVAKPVSPKRLARLVESILQHRTIESSRS